MVAHLMPTLYSCGGGGSGNGRGGGGSGGGGGGNVDADINSEEKINQRTARTKRGQQSVCGGGEG